MNESDRGRWVRAVLVAGVTYFAVGILFGTLAGWAASGQTRGAWRLAAWGIGAAVFAVHIGYEHVRLRSSPPITAWHAALAVALGAGGLAVAALVHSSAASSGRRYIAFLAWPVLVGLPAFLVALAVASVLARARRGT